MKRFCQFLYQKPYSLAFIFIFIAMGFIIWYLNHYPVSLIIFLILSLSVIGILLLFLSAYVFVNQIGSKNPGIPLVKSASESTDNDQCAETKKALKEAQSQLVEQEKMASIGMLTAGIAHEIKNPLNFINNFSEMTIEMLTELKNELAKIPDQPLEIAQSVAATIDDIEGNCKKINEHGKRAESIIKNMLLQSRSAEAEKVPSDVNALLEEYLNLAYHGMRAQNNKFNAKIVKNIDNTLKNVTLSPQGMGRVFLNIIHNGLYAANEKWEQISEQGKHSAFMPTMTVTTMQTADNVIIKIKDNGNGIPESLRKKIFEPFFTTKPPGLGTGLGLPICYDIVVKEHTGKLEIDSQLGEYTEFIITIPKNINSPNINTNIK